MRAVLMVVANIIREEAFQVAFVNCDDVIQEITPATPYPTLCDNGVLSFAKTSHGPNLMHVTCYISTLYVAHFKRGHNFGEAQDMLQASPSQGLRFVCTNSMYN